MEVLNFCTILDWCFLYSFRNNRHIVIQKEKEENNVVQQITANSTTTRLKKTWKEVKSLSELLTYNYKLRTSLLGIFQQLYNIVSQWIFLSTNTFHFSWLKNIRTFISIVITVIDHIHIFSNAEVPISPHEKLNRQRNEINITLINRMKKT